MNNLNEAQINLINTIGYTSIAETSLTLTEAETLQTLKKSRLVRVRETSKYFNPDQIAYYELSKTGFALYETMKEEKEAAHAAALIENAERAAAETAPIIEAIEETPATAQAAPVASEPAPVVEQAETRKSHAQPIPQIALDMYNEGYETGKGMMSARIAELEAQVAELEAEKDRMLKEHGGVSRYETQIEYPESKPFEFCIERGMGFSIPVSFNEMSHDHRMGLVGRISALLYRYMGDSPHAQAIAIMKDLTGEPR